MKNANLKFKKLIFVYNAKSGLQNKMLDAAHKIFSPKTYACNLCSVTFGFVRENSIWKKFKEETNLEMQFLHKDEFTNIYNIRAQQNFTYPIVMALGGNGLVVAVKTIELNKVRDASVLIELIKARFL